MLRTLIRLANPHTNSVLAETHSVAGCYRLPIIVSLDDDSLEGHSRLIASCDSLLLEYLDPIKAQGVEQIVDRVFAMMWNEPQFKFHGHIGIMIGTVLLSIIVMPFSYLAALITYLISRKAYTYIMEYNQTLINLIKLTTPGGVSTLIIRDAFRACQDDIEAVLREAGLQKGLVELGPVPIVEIPVNRVKIPFSFVVVIPPQDDLPKPHITPRRSWNMV